MTVPNRAPFIFHFGFRVTEPHHDGTPHWHLLLFINPDHVEEVTEELKTLSEREDWQELEGLNEVRFKAEKIKTLDKSLMITLPAKLLPIDF